MEIENRPMHCNLCGSGPYYGRESSSTSAYTGDTVVECTWICANCGRTFANGVVQTIPAPVKINEERK